MAHILIVWILNALALLAVAYLMPSIQVASFGTALIAALVLGLVNALIRPLLVILTLPVTLLTLGLFLLVINGLLFWAVGNFVQGFTVTSFWSGFFGAILYSLISFVLTSLL
jgi:putative membrane protein